MIKKIDSIKALQFEIIKPIEFFIPSSFKMKFLISLILIYQIIFYIDAKATFVVDTSEFFFKKMELFKS